MNDRIDHLLALIPEFNGQRTSVSVLDGGLTNSIYKVETDSSAYVMRLAGPNSSLLGINRQFEYESSLAAAAIGAGPDVVAYLPDEGLLMTHYLPGRVLTAPDMQVRSTLQKVIETLRGFHEQKKEINGHFSVFDAAKGYLSAARERNVSFPANLDLALGHLQEIEELVGKYTAVNCPCHNDLLPANFIDDGNKVKIIDWEYAGMGDPFFDLGSLAANGVFEPEHEELLLELYFGEPTIDRLHKLRLMRLASDMRESMWGFLQTSISELDIDYVSYGKEHLDKFICGYERVETAVAKP